MINEDPFEANNIDNIVPLTKKNQNENPQDSAYQNNTIITEEHSESTKIFSVEPEEPKKSKFSTEGVIGFGLSIISFYISVISFVIAMTGIAAETRFLGILGMCFMAGALICSIVALCLCNIGAKKAEYRVFCFIGRGISIFTLCWTAIMLTLVVAIVGIGLNTNDLELFA